MKEIPLTRGYVALVDDEDYDQLMKYKWLYLSTGYAARNPRNGDTSTTTILMHRQILGLNGILQVDHISCDKLDNRRSNLRVVTPHQNCFNRGKNSNNRSGHKGVCWHSIGKKWRAYINLDRKQIHLGLFDDKMEAHKAYQRAASKYHGVCAHA